MRVTYFLDSRSVAGLSIARSIGTLHIVGSFQNPVLHHLIGPLFSDLSSHFVVQNKRGVYAAAVISAQGGLQLTCYMPIIVDPP